VITIQVIDHETGRSAIAEFPSSFGPALRSTLADHANELGERSSGSHHYDKEDALTRAMGAHGPLRAAVNRVIEKEDPHYE
jgi:hypothetical protein